VKVGVCLPVFLPSVDLALDVAGRAEAEGLDGVFSFDHLFPAGQPERPALSALPVLAAVAVRTSRLCIGTLVSRVGILDLAVQVAGLTTLQELSRGRLIAALGAGDSRSQPENDAYGLPGGTVEHRLGLLTDLVRATRGRGIEVWIGGNSPRVRLLAESEADNWNCWNLSAPELADLPPATGGGRTWGGVPPADGDLAGHLGALSAAGASWVIYGPAPGVDWPSFVTKLAGAVGPVR
jgi:alkanesulfonate monooxygenase SsuD/methylene tetrahydromethanopterin reductase-like flavin-dependent oxidoreductase (luciferase family)